MACSLGAEMGKTEGFRMTLRRAKFNFKYRRQKKQKPRLNADDVAAYQHLLEGTQVHFGYDPDTNDLWFDVPSLPSDRSIECDGLDTGGQVIRWWLQWTILKAGGRSGPPAPLTIPSAGKACMLYIQAVMYTLKEGESFTVRGGDPGNTAAPGFHFQQELYAEIRGMVGLSFRLEDEAHLNDGQAQFTLTREEDVAPDPTWCPAQDPLSIHMTDQLMMAASFARPVRTVVLRCEVKRDYHVGAMGRLMVEDGMEVEDVEAGGARTITIKGTGGHV